MRLKFIIFFASSLLLLSGCSANRAANSPITNEGPTDDMHRYCNKESIAIWERVINEKNISLCMTIGTIRVKTNALLI